METADTCKLVLQSSKFDLRNLTDNEWHEVKSDLGDDLPKGLFSSVESDFSDDLPM